MRRFKVWTAVLALLAVLLLGGLASAAQLSDVSTSWAKADIEALMKDGIISGYPDNTFRPEHPVTRAEFARILSKAFHYEPSGRNNFSDIQNHWAEKDINALVEKEIIQGYPDGSFKPDTKISRAEMATMLTRAIKLDGDFNGSQFGWWPSFEDVPEDHWAYNSVEIANRLGIVPSVIATRFPNHHKLRISSSVCTFVCSRMSNTLRAQSLAFLELLASDASRLDWFFNPFVIKFFRYISYTLKTAQYPL